MPLDFIQGSIPTFLSSTYHTRRQYESSSINQGVALDSYSTNKTRTYVQIWRQIVNIFIFSSFFNTGFLFYSIPASLSTR